MNVSRPLMGRLAAYEGPDYRLGHLVVQMENGDSRRALAFLARHHVRLTASAFRFAVWRALSRRDYLRRLAVPGGARRAPRAPIAPWSR